MSELEQERQESTLSDGGGEFEEFELALSAEHVITAYGENDELTHVVITGLELETLQAAIGYAPELVRCAPQGLLQVWYAVDDVCKSRGWNWSRESPTLTYCKIYARPDGANEPYVRIDFDAEGVGNPDYLNFFDTGDPRTRDKWADASSFIEAVKDLIFIGLGYGTKTPFLESYFERLIKSPDSTVDPSAIGTRAKSLGMQIGRLERWDRITQSYYPQGLTQRRIAEIEMVSTVAIRNDFRDMREHGLLPPVGPKSTP